MAMTEASTSASREKDAVDVEASVGGHGKRLLVLEKKRGRLEMAGGCVITAKERISRMAPCVAGKRSSIYRGVTRHRWTGRYEAHLWDKSTWNENQNKKGKQVYLGAYDDEEAAGRAYDLAALKFWGPGTLINFPVSDYSRDLEEMQLMSKEEYLASLRRKSSAFSKGFPRCRAMPRVPENSQWETSLSYVLGTNRDAKTKIDLSSLLNWWGPRNAHQLDTSDMLSKNLEAEIRALESSLECTQPYKFPYLARPNKRIPQEHGASASDVLAQSSSFKNLKKYVESHDYYEEITEKNCQTMLEPSLAVGAVGLADGFDLYACDSLEQEPDYLPWEKLPLQEKARDEGDCERTARKP